MGRFRAGHDCRPLSTRTTRKIHYIIRSALERAIGWRYLGVNKATMAEAPTPRRTEPDPPSAQETAALLNAAWVDPECPFTGGPWCQVVAGVGSQGLPVRALWMASMARMWWPRVLTR